MILYPQLLKEDLHEIFGSWFGFFAYSNSFVKHYEIDPFLNFVNIFSSVTIDIYGNHYPLILVKIDSSGDLTGYCVDRW